MTPQQLRTYEELREKIEQRVVDYLHRKNKLPEVYTLKVLVENRHLYVELVEWKAGGTSSHTFAIPPEEVFT